MHLPQSLVAAIESTHVAYEGLSHPLRVVDVTQDPGATDGKTVDLTVETAHEGESRRASCHFTADQLQDTPSVVAALAASMRARLASGEKKGGS